MIMTQELQVEKREGTAHAVRTAGNVPAVVYGKGAAAETIVLNKMNFEKVLRETGESTIFTLTGLAKEVDVLIHDVAFNPSRGGVDHVDFYIVEKGKELTTNVALEFTGESPMEKTGAMVVKVLQEVEVTCLPNDLPGHITVDVSGMATADAHITVADLPVLKGVVVTTDAEQVVATIAAARGAEPETETPTAEVAPGAPDAK